MAHSWLSIDWQSFLRELDSPRQREFEEDLAARDMTLGEYMEIVEQAAMEASARSAYRVSSVSEEEELVRIAAAMLSRYVSRKALLSEYTRTDRGVSGLYGSPSLSTDPRHLAASVTSGFALARRIQLRSAINRRIEAIKSGRNKP